MNCENPGADEGPPTVAAGPPTTSRGPWLLEFGSPERFQSVVLRCGDCLTVGSGSSASVRVDDRTVSAMHCRLHATERGVGVEDMQSRNGVYVGAARVRSALLASVGSSFVLGQTTVTLHRCLEGTPNASGDIESVPGLIGSSVPMRCLMADIHRVAKLRAPILVCGESGTGKDVVARAIHELSGRVGPYVPLNASAVPDSLADAELFGHQRGAFTGAVTNRTGTFEHAHRGTLFLDEVADLSPAVQVKLLRVIEDGLVRPVGANAALKVDVRIITATWVDLSERIGEGRFRPDLFHRIATFVLHIPPLKDRRSDIPALAAFLLSGFKEELGTKRLSSAAIAYLGGYGWPGNVRELRSALYRAAAVANGDVLGPEHFESIAPARLPRPKALESLDVVALLKQHDGNITAASRSARLPRTTFRSRLDRARRSKPS